MFRAMGFNKGVVNKFFNLLKDLYEKHNSSHTDIYNVDERDINVVLNKPFKVLAYRMEEAD